MDTDIDSIVGTFDSSSSHHFDDSDQTLMREVFPPSPNSKKELIRLQTWGALLDTAPNFGPPDGSSYSPELVLEDDLEIEFAQTCIGATTQHNSSLKIYPASREQLETKLELICSGEIDSYNSPEVESCTSGNLISASILQAQSL